MEKLVPVQVKWGKEKFALDLNVDGTLDDFKAALYSLSFVPVDKQKIIFKGKTLKDDVQLSTLNIKEKAMFMLMGSAEGMGIDEQEKKKAVFIEDLTPQQLAELYKEKTGQAIPVGLVNLGNTCYMNSCLQCLRRVNELKDYFKKNPQPKGQSIQHTVSSAFGQLVTQMESAGQSVKPIQFLQSLFTAVPQFAEKEGPAFKQQDADECYMAISSCLEQGTPKEDLEGNPTNLMKELFEIEFQVTMQNTDNPEEQPTIREEVGKKLMCQIDNQSNPTNHMLDGLKLALTEQVEKLSDVDQQNHIYNKISQIKKLPSYLAVQMSRFYWKEAVKEAETQAGKVKILRAVSFPKVLDVYSLCTDELKKSLDYGREFEQKIKDQQDQKNKDRFDQWKAEQEEKGKILPDDSKVLWKMFKEAQTQLDIQEHDNNLYREHGQGLDAGNYQLVAVLTHQGRSSDSGHYISWIHNSGDNWLKFDDDKVTECKIDQITELKGGGDWHMGYYFFYRKIELVSQE